MTTQRKEGGENLLLSGVAKPYALLSRRVSAIEAKFQVIFLGTQLFCFSIEIFEKHYVQMIEMGRKGWGLSRDRRLKNRDDHKHKEKGLAYLREVATQTAGKQEESLPTTQTHTGIPRLVGFQ